MSRDDLNEVFRQQAMQAAGEIRNADWSEAHRWSGFMLTVLPWLASAAANDPEILRVAVEGILKSCTEGADKFLVTCYGFMMAGLVSTDDHVFNRDMASIEREIEGKRPLSTREDVIEYAREVLGLD